MKKIFLVVAVVLILLVQFMIAEKFLKVEISEGKNNIFMNYSLGHASDLTKLYPEIETITYEEDGEKIGYVNVFGGIGKDFLLEPNKTYEINSNKNITIYVK